MDTRIEKKAFRLFDSRTKSPVSVELIMASSCVWDSLSLILGIAFRFYAYRPIEARRRLLSYNHLRGMFPRHTFHSATSVVLACDHVCRPEVQPFRRLRYRGR